MSIGEYKYNFDSIRKDIEALMRKSHSESNLPQYEFIVAFLIECYFLYIFKMDEREFISTIELFHLALDFQANILAGLITNKEGSDITKNEINEMIKEFRIKYIKFINDFDQSITFRLNRKVPDKIN